MQPIYDENYIKTKIKTFNDVINSFFRQWNSKRKFITLVLQLSIDSVMKIDKNYP